MTARSLPTGRPISCHNEELPAQSVHNVHCTCEGHYFFFGLVDEGGDGDGVGDVLAMVFEARRRLCLPPPPLNDFIFRSSHHLLSARPTVPC